MSHQSQLEDLIEAGRKILRQGCESKLCHEWRNRAFRCLSDLLGPEHNYAKYFQVDEPCDIRSLIARAQLLSIVKDLLSRGKPIGP